MRLQLISLFTLFLFNDHCLLLSIPLHSLTPHTMTTLSSPPPSPLLARSSSGSGDSSSSTSHPRVHMPHMPLSVSNVANLFVKMRRHRARAKAHHIESASGDAPQTHPGLDASGAASPERIPLERNETFVCRDGVDATKLLRAVRGALYEKAQTFGANVLVDERVSPYAVLTSRDSRWTCTICGPRHRSDGTFRVYIHYSANAARSDRRDPQRPVALENARGVPGLMTIVNRLD
ncbi:hypothetical protein ACG7TL_009156 [Trametes sanguinea]